MANPEPPPAYAPAPKLHANATLTKDDLKGRQFILIVDKSGSMTIEDMKNDAGQEVSRWLYMQESVLAFASTLDALDPDGIDFALFNDGEVWKHNVHQDGVKGLLQSHIPRGGTVMGPVLQSAIGLFFKQKVRQPTIILIITDGCPSDKEHVARVIVAASKQLTSDVELGIQIIQVGHDQAATVFLKELDDDLQEKYDAPYDIVDTTAIDDVTKRGGLKQVLLNAIND